MALKQGKNGGVVKTDFDRENFLIPYFLSQMPISRELKEGHLFLAVFFKIVVETEVDFFG